MSTEDRLDVLLALAREVRDPQSALGQEVRSALFATSGLHRSGVELALRDHLEIDATADERGALRAWCSARVERCHVILSANVCTAALRAIALGLESGERVFVRPSRRDAALAAVLVRELASRGVAIERVEEISPALGDHVHAYGSDETLDAIEAKLPEGVVFRGHGAGFGVAVVGASTDLEDAAERLARDVVPFDQAGCLSPRVVLIEGSTERALAFIRAASGALGAAALRVPRGELDAATRASLTSFRASMEAVGEVCAQGDHLVAFAEDVETLELPPAARAVLVLPLDTCRRWLEPVARWVTTVGLCGSPVGFARKAADTEDDDALRSLSHARVTELGSMQRPPLDGPVDRRATFDRHAMTTRHSVRTYAR